VGSVVHGIGDVNNISIFRQKGGRMSKLQSKQAVLNKVARHLVKQNESSLEGPTCMYYGPNGLKCAIGCLIPENLYYKGLETMHVTSKSVLRVLGAVINFKKVDKDFLEDLQRVHDNEEPEYWKAKLSEVAKDYGLKQTKEIKEVK